MSRLIGLFGVFVLTVGLASPALAQDASRPYVQIAHITVEPGMALQFENIVKQYVDAAAKTGATNRWVIFQVGPGGSPDHYHLITTFETFAERDNWMPAREMFVEAHGDKAYAESTRAWSQVVAEIRTTVERAVLELSSTLESDGAIKQHYLVAASEVRPEKLNDFRFAMQKIRAGQDQTAGSPHRTTRRVVEGNRYVFKTITGFDSGADRDRWPTFGEFMSKYSDQETAQILTMLNGSQVSSNWYEVSLRSDLSYQGESTTSN